MRKSALMQDHLFAAQRSRSKKVAAQQARHRRAGPTVLSAAHTSSERRACHPLAVTLLALAHRPSHVPNGGTTRILLWPVHVQPARSDEPTSAPPCQQPRVKPRCARWLMANKHAQHAQVTSGDRGAFDRPFGSRFPPHDRRSQDRRREPQSHHVRLQAPEQDTRVHGRLSADADGGRRPRRCLVQHRH